MTQLISPKDFTYVTTRLRKFFSNREFLEVHTQNRLSILAACEDPSTIGTFSYSGATYPLPQTGQMWLEYELLSDPTLKGVYCVSTSFRQESNPIEGRHDLIFPMFEFEMPGNMNDLLNLEIELCKFLEFKLPFSQLKYQQAMTNYNTNTIEAEHEAKIQKDFGDIVFLTDFPYHTSPFWNMKRNNKTNTANKIDVIIYGIETIGSAERSCDKKEMFKQFMTISNGMYAKLLFSIFGKDRVIKELDAFLKFEFFTRSGGGIGLTRLIRAINLLK